MTSHQCLPSMDSAGVILGENASTLHIDPVYPFFKMTSNPNIIDEDTGTKPGIDALIAGLGVSRGEWKCSILTDGCCVDLSHGLHKRQLADSLDF